MVALAFDTLTASKALRVQRTTEMPDVSHLATKDDLEHTAAKLASKSEVAVVRTDLAAAVARLELSISTNNNLMLDRMRMQALQIVGATAAMLGVFFALLKFT